MIGSGVDTGVFEVSPESYIAHAVHTDTDRIWPQTNCYSDLWIEALHLCGHNPIPAFLSSLSADHDGHQWTFIKPDPTDLRVLYGIVVGEETVWRPLLDTVEAAKARGLLHTIEVDSWFLPDTAGTTYGEGHSKTTILPLHVNRDQRTMTYLHNSGAYSLVGDDFDGVFSITPNGLGLTALELPPYIEQIRIDARLADPGRALELAAEHVRCRPLSNPLVRLNDSVISALDWLPTAGMETFHRWTFANLRQCGSTAELAADVVEWLDDTGAVGARAASEPFRAVAQGAKSVQFHMARAARGRAVDPRDALALMSDAWHDAMEIVENTVR